VQSAGVLSIGEFSRLSHLSIRTLRRYHDAGLLEPARIDAASGYRYYAADQIPVAQVIHRLRELDVPLADVRQILRTADLDTRTALVAEHLRRLEDQLTRTRAAVVSLQRLLRPEPAGLDVELRHVPAMPVAAVAASVDHAQVLDWYSGAAAELDAAVPHPAGAPGGLYDNELFTDGRGRALVYLPVAEPSKPSGRVRAMTLPAVELAVTTHRGDHDTIDVTYGRLGSWVVDHTLAVAGPVREVYLVGPRDTPDPGRWRTEIGWPVFQVAAVTTASIDQDDREGTETS
jgi:DNA-binding transcriptional MerR regulator